MKSFSTDEIKELTLASILVLGVFFSMLFFENRLEPFFVLLIMIGGIFMYLIHEFSHKYLARHYGLVSQFRISREGALFTAISIIPFFPLKFIAPGTVETYGSAKDDEVGRVALIGPMTNLVLAGFFLVLSGASEFIFPMFDALIITQLGIVFYYLAWFSSSIAFFNMIPFGPLDGFKVLNYMDREIFITTFGITLVSWLVIAYN